MPAKMFAISMDERTSELLDAMARQSFRTRSGMIQFLVEQEYKRQVEEMHRATQADEAEKVE